MGRVVAATVAFYIGIICIIVSVLIKGFGLNIMGIGALSFIHLANAWFLIAIVCYVHNIWVKVGSEIKKSGESKPSAE